MRLLALAFCATTVLAPATLVADDTPPADAFQVFEQTLPMGPRITPYLRYQTEQAWKQDNQRQAAWAGIHTEKELLQVQGELRKKLLQMIGGLPEKKTDLHPRITAKIEMDGFSIEKLIFESLPGVYVTALVYLPSDHSSKSPAVLVPAGHAPNGKIYYQELCQRLAKRGYVVLAWDPVGQGERSQFWDAQAGKSRYNLICAEHAVMGNLAYLAGANLARWEIWDGIRAVDYLLTRPEVDAERISIVGTSGGGFQAAHIAALDKSSSALLLHHRAADAYLQSHFRGSRQRPRTGSVRHDFEWRGQCRAAAVDVSAAGSSRRRGARFFPHRRYS
jgi:dienelactone hydrolase